jgi:hypothetical protein
MNDPARQVELLTEARAQPGGADALRADDRVPLENDRRDPAPGRLASGRPPGRSAAYHEELGRLHAGRPFAADGLMPVGGAEDRTVTVLNAGPFEAHDRRSGTSFMCRKGSS